MYYVSDGGTDGIEEWMTYKTTNGNCTLEYYQYAPPNSVLLSLPRINQTQMQNIINDRSYVLQTGYSWGSGPLKCASRATYCDLGDYATAGIGNQFTISKTLNNAMVYQELTNYFLRSDNLNSIVASFRTAWNGWHSIAARMVWSCSTGERSSFVLDNGNGQTKYFIGNNLVARY